MHPFLNLLTEPLGVDINTSGGDNLDMNMTTISPALTMWGVSDYDRHLVALGVMSSFALMGVVYSAALIAFNCSKGKDR